MTTFSTLKLFTTINMYIAHSQMEQRRVNDVNTFEQIIQKLRKIA